MNKRLVFFVTEDWYFCSHRIDLAKAAIAEGYEVYLITRVNNHAHIIESQGINLLPLNIERSNISFFADLKLIWSLINIFRKLKPSILHNVAIKPVLYGSLGSLFVPSMKVVNALGGLGFVFSSNNMKAKLLRPFVKFSFKYLLEGKRNSLIVQNKDDYHLFIEKLGIKANKVRMIKGSGIDHQKLVCLPEPNGIIRVTLLARMLEDKGVFEFVEAAKLLKEKGHNWNFELVGDPDPLNPASIPEKVLCKWRDSGIVEWHGFQSDIAKVWSTSHISVLPSYREGLPKSLLESAACCRAIITTDVPGCREIVTNEFNGLLVPAKDSVALAYAIERLALDAKLRKEMAKNGRELIETELSSDKIHEQTLKLYKDIHD